MTQETTTKASPRWPHTRMLGKVLFSVVDRIPGIEPADRPSHSYLNRSAFGAGCSVISVKARGLLRPPAP